MIFLLVLSHLVTDQLLAWFHSIHISIYILSLRPLVAFAFNIRIQHSLELNSARKLNRFCIWKRKFLFRFVARNREKKPNLCRVSHHIPVRKCCCSVCNPLDPTLSAPLLPTFAPLPTVWGIVNTIQWVGALACEYNSNTIAIGQPIWPERMRNVNKIRLRPPWNFKCIAIDFVPLCTGNSWRIQYSLLYMYTRLFNHVYCLMHSCFL